MFGVVRPLSFVGSALADLRAFPAPARRDAGFQLDRVQNGLDPNDWKPMASVGPGVREIRIWDTDGTFRIIYVARFEAAIYVLHCFQKKTQATRTADLALARRRYQQLLKG